MPGLLRVKVFRTQTDKLFTEYLSLITSKSRIPSSVLSRQLWHTAWRFM